MAETDHVGREVLNTPSVSALFADMSASLNNILLYALCAKIFTDTEMEHITAIWEANVREGIKGLYHPEVIDKVISDVKVAVVNLVKMTRDKK